MTSATVAFLLLALQILTGISEKPYLDQTTRSTGLQTVQLLSTVSTISAQNPELIPQSVQDAVLELGHRVETVIDQAQPVVPTTPESPLPVVQPVTQPQLGSVPNNPQVPMAQPEPEKKSTLVVTQLSKTAPDPINNAPYGEYAFKVSLIDPNGVYVRDQDITMDAPNNVYPNPDTRRPNARPNANSSEWYTSYGYVPTTSGQKTLTFTSGDVSKTIVLDVQ